MRILKVSGATPLTQIRFGSTAMLKGVVQHQHTTVRKAIRLVAAIWEGGIPLPAEELVKSGQRHNLMSTTLLMWESTTTAETRMGNLMESGATPLTQMCGGSTALFQYVEHITVRKVIRLVSLIQES